MADPSPLKTEPQDLRTFADIEDGILYTAQVYSSDPLAPRPDHRRRDRASRR